MQKNKLAEHGRPPHLLAPRARRGQTAVCIALLGALAAACGVASPERVGVVSSELTGTDLTPAWTEIWDDTGRTKDEKVALTDADPNTRVEIPGLEDKIVYQLARPAVVTNYELTAQTIAAPDPQAWTLEGSPNGVDWTQLDAKSSQSFARGETKTFSVANSTQFLFVRLSVTAVNNPSLWKFYLAGFRVGGTLSTGTLPSAPVVGAATVSGNSISFSWTATNATSYRVRRYASDGEISDEIPVTSTSYTDTSVRAGMAYSYTVQALNGTLRGGFVASKGTARVPGGPSGLKDLTALATAPTIADWQHPSWPASNVTDSFITSKWYATETHATSSLIQVIGPDAVVKQYTLTSANDYPKRDPKSWVLEGSNVDTDSSWVQIDTRPNRVFSARRQTLTFDCSSNTTAYRRYRLRITANAGAPDLQLSEWRLFGTTSAVLGLPPKPTGLAVEALSNDQLKLTLPTRATLQNPETGYIIERATDLAFSRNLVTRTVGPATADVVGDWFEYRAVNLTPGTTYYFRMKAQNAAGTSAYSDTVAQLTKNDPPPAAGAWQENGWYTPPHRGVLSPVFNDSNIRVYQDQRITPALTPSSISWITPALSEGWSYIKTTYPVFSGSSLYVLLDPSTDALGDTYGAAGVLHSTDPSTTYRKGIFTMSGKWTTPGYSYASWSLPSLIHEMNHAVEYENNEIIGSPSYPIWGDSHWGEIFMYDVYQHLATVPATQVTQANASELLSTWWDALDGIGVRWLQDWYSPLYNGTLGNTGASQKGAAFLAKYFRLLSQSFPKAGNRYARDLNLGEYINFCSGAAGVDLTNAARTVFRFERRPEAALQLEAAKRDFPEITALYSSSCSAESDAAFCARLSASCGSLSGSDNCGNARSVTSCGSCTSPQSCGGGGTANVCGGGGGTTPCASLCSSPVVFAGPGYYSGSLGVNATCHQTSANLGGVVCGNFDASRTFRINDVAVNCNNPPIALPAKRNGGYCFQASAGTPSYSYFQTY